jgi:hypothetical protein
MANADVEGFHRWATDLTNQAEGFLDIIFSEREVFVRAIAVIYRIFGINDQQINFLIFVCALVVYIYIYQL